MGRPDDWAERLNAAIDAVGRRRFAWGYHDCALAVCDAIQAMTGIDPARDFRGRYATREEAAAALLRWGYPDLEEAAASLAFQYGFREIRPKLAQRGDIVMWDDPEVGSALGIVSLDPRIAVFAGPRGLGRVPVWMCTRAWRVA